MIRFGPAGNSDAFYDEGYKHTTEAFKWLDKKNIDAFEYQCTRGVLIKRETAEKIGAEAAKYDIRLSLHAPYYINFAGTEKDKLEKSRRHIEKSIEAALWMGAKRVVVHPGGIGKDSRDAAMKRAIAFFSDIIKNQHHSELLAPELMGKINQLGNLDEIIAFCGVDDSTIPTIDFGHLNARTKGALNSPEAFENVIMRLANGIGWERTRRIHVHFSRIEFTENGGEKRHWSMKDTQFGPEFDHFIPILIKYDMRPVIISESRGTQAADAKMMKERFLKCV
ncbi:MAG: TIM barrel protein [Clostridiales bacterium]|nr:TIM barrel protein [Clostridiales bacterium]